MHVQGGFRYRSSAAATLRTLIELVGPTDEGIPKLKVNPRDFLGKLWACTLVDLAGGVDFRSFNVELVVQHLFDERNDLSHLAGCSSCTRTLVVSGTPRTIALRIGTKS